MRDASVHRRTDRHRSCDDRFVTGALQITLPFDTPTEAASAPLSRDKGPVDVATPVRLAPAPSSVFIAPTTVEIAPTGSAPASVAIGLSSVALAPFYFVRHRRARRYLLRVEPDGRLRVTIPRGGSRREAEAFATRNVEWVRDQRTRLAAAAFDPSERAALRAQAAAELPARIRQLAARPDASERARLRLDSRTDAPAPDGPFFSLLAVCSSGVPRVCRCPHLVADQRPIAALNGRLANLNTDIPAPELVGKCSDRAIVNRIRAS